MKFSDIFEEILNEGKGFSEEKFDRFVQNAGWWLFDQFQNTPSDIRILPGYGDYIKFAKERSKDELNSWDDFVYTLPDFYGDWINRMLPRDSNKIISQTVARFNFQDKMLGKENYVPKKRGRKPKAQDVEPQADDSRAHFDQAIEKKKRGRPRKIKTDDTQSYDDIVQMFKQKNKPTQDEPTPEFTLEPTNEPTMDVPKPKKSYYTPKGTPRGRPSKETKYEPTMAQTRIKTLEDKIASLEALLREKGILQEQKALIESRLQMMKDYQKFL